jgi:hypothetical protein
MSAVTALGSLTAAVALLAGSPDASAQPAQAGGGSFPGSFLVPGTNTSIKIGGFVKIVGIKDLGGAGGDTVANDAIPLHGSAGAGLHGNFKLHARQSNLSVDTRTPTAYGDLTTFVLVDMFGQNTSEAQNQSNVYNTRLVYAYGTLGPLLAGQWVSLFSDTDAIIESVDPTGFIGNMDGLDNRSPQFRYTFAAPGGFSVAVDIENPEAEGITNSAVGAVAAPGPFTASKIGGVDKYPDVLARVRLDQAWGHIALSAMWRDMVIEAAGVPRESKASYAASLSGHLNTFGKDAFKWTLAGGKAPGHYLTTLGRSSGADGLEFNPVTGAVAAPTAWTVSLGYTHWWTGALRSSVQAGYGHNTAATSVLTAAAALAADDKRQTGGRVNLIWSPVPQVDLGAEYIYARRVVQTGLAGNFHRVEIESVFKF